MMGSALYHIATTLSVAWNGYASLYTFPKVSKGRNGFYHSKAVMGLGNTLRSYCYVRVRVCVCACAVCK